jgi:hypothetical protein
MAAIVLKLLLTQFPLQVPFCHVFDVISTLKILFRQSVYLIIISLKSLCPQYSYF